MQGKERLLKELKTNHQQESTLPLIVTFMYPNDVERPVNIIKNTHMFALKLLDCTLTGEATLAKAILGNSTLQEIKIKMFMDERDSISHSSKKW